MKVPKLIDRSLESQIIFILIFSFILIFIGQVMSEYLSLSSLDDNILDLNTTEKRSMTPKFVDYISDEKVQDFVQYFSSCHEGVTLTDKPFSRSGAKTVSEGLLNDFAKGNSLRLHDVRIVYVKLTTEDFSYSTCKDLELPLDGAVASVKLNNGKWMNFEVHTHKLDVTNKLLQFKLKQSAFTLFFTGLIAIFFIKRATLPLKDITKAAQQFGAGLQVEAIPERGRSDLKSAIRAFNTMQIQVKESVDKKTTMLTTISHDIRTPLTALRVKVEQVKNQETQDDLIKSINKIENLTASALDFLRGESLAEELRLVNLNALIESECSELQELGHTVKFFCSDNILYECRSNAMGRAIRNLIENAVKYGDRAYVELEHDDNQIQISISDDGPGIHEDKVKQVLKPFERLSEARESDQGGFGLGLSIVNAIINGHQGELIFTNSELSKFQVIIKLPIKI